MRGAYAPERRHECAVNTRTLSHPHTNAQHKHVPHRTVGCAAAAGLVGLVAAPVVGALSATSQLAQSVEGTLNLPPLQT